METSSATEIRAASAATAGPGGDSLNCTARARQYQKKWFEGFRRRVLENGEHYVIAEPSTPHEIFHAMDVDVLSVPWYSSVISAKQLSPHYLKLMDELGFHDRLPRYTTLPMMTTLENNPQRAPYGGLPRPVLLMDRLRGDFPQRIGEQWARAFGTRYFPIDNPALTRLAPHWWEKCRHEWEELYETHRLDFVEAQYQELIREAELATGKTFRQTEFIEQMHQINRLGELVDEAKALIAKARPCPIALPEQIANIMAATWHRGSQWAVDHLAAYVDEIRELVLRGVGACANERVRLLWLNNGLWFNTDFYRAFEERFGAVFVWSMYTNYLADGYVRYFSDNALRALASRHCTANDQLHLPPFMADWIIQQARDFGADGAVMLVPREDRISGYGTTLARMAIEAAGIPVLELHANAVDARLWDELKMVSAVEEFIASRILAKR